MQNIEQILLFIIEIEQLKDILRKSRPVGLKRYENSAEHSWHVALSAMLLKEYSNSPINIEHVIKMLLIHDLGEIDAGDKIIYDRNCPQQIGSERASVERLFAILPETMATQYISLWHEFEAGKTNEAKFAKAIDRVPPLLHNLHDNGHSWQKHGIDKQQVYELNGKAISNGSESLWAAIRQKLDQAVKDGILR